MGSNEWKANNIQNLKNNPPVKLPVSVDFGKLKQVAKNATEKNSAEDTSIVLNEYINLMSNMLATAKKTDEKKLALLTISLQNWLLSNDAPPRVNPDLRAICMVNLGNVYNPEAAYEHPVIVLEKIPNENLVLIVPTKTTAYDKAYDVETNPTGDKYILKADKSNNFDGNCGIELKHLRVISTSRIISFKGKVDSAKFQDIKTRLIELYFPKKAEKLDFILDETFEKIKKFINDDPVKLQDTIQMIDKAILEIIS